VALGPVTATATMSTTAAAVLATLQTGERPEFTLHVELTTGEGDERLVTGEASVLWTLRPQRR
jgi:hypothetical protein